LSESFASASQTLARLTIANRFSGGALLISRKTCAAMTRQVFAAHPFVVAGLLRVVDASCFRVSDMAVNVTVFASFPIASAAARGGAKTPRAPSRFRGARFESPRVRVTFPLGLLGSILPDAGRERLGRRHRQVL
jgi:hypothetical protein